MSPSDNGWAEHKALVEWRLEQNEKAIRELRCDNDVAHSGISTQLSQIQTTLAGFTAVKERKSLLLNLVVPALVALGVLAGEAAVAYIWR